MSTHVIIEFFVNGTFRGYHRVSRAFAERLITHGRNTKHSDVQTRIVCAAEDSDRRVINRQSGYARVGKL